MTARLRDVFENKSVAIVAGSGGVGKTTTSAAIAVQAALESDRRVLVLTVDPARRLADALGGEDLGDDAKRISPGRFVEAGLSPKGELWASMLDTKKAWDRLVLRHAPDKQTADAILSNHLYANISGRFVQSHDYIAMERLFELHDEGEYDLIVVDTPPSSHASDLLDAPQRLADFFDSRLLRFLVAPSKSKLAMLTARPFLQLADRLLGKRFLSDISEFFTLLESMRPGFIDRAEKVQALLASSETSFSVVTTLEPAAVREAAGLLEGLEERHFEVGAIIANRTLPDYLSNADLPSTADALRSGSSFADLDHAATERVLDELRRNADRMRHLSNIQMTQSKALAERAKLFFRIPWISGELRSLRGLTNLGETIW